MTVATIIILLITVIYVYLVAKCCIVFHNYDDNTASVTSELTTSVSATDIIVSAKNESQNITKFLDSIKAQTLDGAHL
ncbi:MAG: hypothetical protein II075_08315, partial [Bacteroidales bacterium]|nr:hypothetical protein [Bacteroidales bacterium]